VAGYFALDARYLEVSMSNILLGALFVLAGVVFLAAQAMRRGPLSSVKRDVRGVPPSLEPRRQGGILDLKANWPGYAVIALGALLLLIGAAG
jgi:hypothetical protein